MTSPQTADVLIVGGAAMGSSLAWHLLAHPGFAGRVVVVEKDPTYARSASALSAASIRSQFSSAVNVRISLHGIRFLRAIGEHLAVDGDAPEIGLKEGGYLYLANAAQEPGMRAAHALQCAEGADVALLDPAALVARFPWLNPGKDVVLGSLGLSGEGWFDGWGLLQAFRRKAKALGAHYVSGEVVDLVREGSRITHAVLADGERIACGTLVDCAGAGGRAVAAMAGVDLPVFARPRYVFTFSCRGDVPNCPLLIDTSGVYVRPEGESAEGRQFICGVSPGPDEDEGLAWRDDDPATQAVDWSFFEERIWPALAARVPAFEAIRPGAAWAGPYDMCALDCNALIGPVAPLGPDNMLVCNGFSGHGLQQAPAVGRGLAEWIVEGRYATLDLSDLGFLRVRDGRRDVERNVI
ncbi:NAD(P)/FAD-dependent oxidoreductase [Salinarimonas sp. NSM]|uniref:NAD(P)/FAD-dependent oxidoreductase n=1 Tax=Salinarimonas sp. NSM TaxID=3458003 RepID=UPI00403502DB